MDISLKDILHDRVRALLHLETEAGLGCTDPAAIGLAAAAAPEPGGWHGLPQRGARERTY